MNSESDWKVCRVCLEQTGMEMLDIFTSEEDTCESLAIRIMNCGGIPVYKTDGFPKRICSECINELEIALKFRNTCRNSHKLLSTFCFTIKDQPKPPVLETLPPVKIENLKQKEPIEKSKKKVKNEIDDSDEFSELNSKTNLADETYEDSKVEIFEHFEDDTINTSIDEDDECEEKPLILEISATEKIVNNKAEKSKKLKTSKNVDQSKISTLSTKYNDRLSNRHKKVPTGTNATFICYLCGNIYNTKYKLDTHIRQHNQEKSHECEICHKRFATSPQLSRHMNSHTGNRPFKCKTCPASFSDPSTCIKHQRIHTNERPYKCEECGKTFAYSNVLKVHKMVHTGEKPYSCEICGKQFAQHHHKKSHIQTHLTSKHKLKMSNYINRRDIDDLVVKNNL